MLTRGHAHMKVSRATWAAYDSVIFTLRSGPGGIARDQFGDGGTRIERSPRQLSEVTSSELFDIGQLPRLIEQRLLGSIKASEHLEAALGVRRNPVRLSQWRWRGSEVEVHRTVAVLLQSRRLRRAADPPGILYERMRGAVINRRRPVLSHRGV